MIKPVLAIWAILAFWCWLVYRVYLSYINPYQQEITNLNNHVRYVVKLHNDKNHKLIKANYRIQELEEANKALIKVCNPSKIKVVSI